MGMDGISIANTGAVKESTSAEYAGRTEQAIQSDASNEAQQVQTLSTNQRVRRKSNEEETGKKRQDETFDDGYKEESQEANQQEDYDEEAELNELENPDKDFYVKLNIKDDIIELYDSATNRLIETISGNELGELVQKLNMASGIFINKKV